MNTLSDLLEQKEELETKINDAKEEASKELSKKLESMQGDFEKVFDADKYLQKSLKNLENMENGEYAVDSCGALCYRVDVDLSDFRECLDELENYLDYQHLDTEGEFLESCCGDDYYSIQSDYRFGEKKYSVYQGGKEVISMSDPDNNPGFYPLLYRAINEHMEQNGYFPEVIEADDRGYTVDLSGGYYEWLETWNKESKKTNDKKISCIVDGNRGIHIPTEFFNSHLSDHWSFEDISDGADKSDYELLGKSVSELTEKEVEEHAELWDELLDGAYLIDSAGFKWTLHQDNDLFLVREDWKKGQNNE